MNPTIEQLEHRYKWGKAAVRIANKIGDAKTRSRAFAALNRARGRLKSATSSVARYEPDFRTRINGIPCYVHVLSYQRGLPATFDHPQEYPEMEFIIVDGRGYPMKFLQSQADEFELIQEYEQCVLKSWRKEP